MDVERISEQIKELYGNIITTEKDPRQTIEDIYDPQAQLTNPYLVLSNREEIVKSYQALASNNMDLFFTVDTVTFDKNSQTVMADVRQVLRPKALGGVMSVNMHYILKLQLEQGDNGLYKIVNHLEIHAAQDMISQVPIIGNFYDQSLRNAVGQISLAGSSLLEYTGVLDMLPKAVEKTKGAASALSRGVGSLASGATGIAGSALERTGVSSLLNYAAGYAKYYGSIMIEEGRGEHVDCYVPTCRPGLLCYSPTCPRGKSYQWMTRDAISDIVKGAYSTAAKRAPFLSTHNPK